MKEVLSEVSNINPLNIKEGFNPPLPSERIKIGVFIHDIEELKLYYIRGRWFITPFPSLNPRGGWGGGYTPFSPSSSSMRRFKLYDTL